MRKGTTIVALVALLVAIFATAAYAVIQCDGGSCFGTSNPDILYEDNANNVDDQMYGYGSADSLYAYGFTDDRDKLYGGRGNDYLAADDGDDEDLLVGGRGRNDDCWGDLGDEFQGCDGNVHRLQ